MKVTNKNFGNLLAAIDLATSTPYLCNLPELLDDHMGSWATCDGRLLSAAEYSHLHDVIGYAYGRSPISSYFRLPDYRGRVVDPQPNGHTLDVIIKIRPDDRDSYPVGSTINISRKPSDDTHT